MRSLWLQRVLRSRACVYALLALTTLPLLQSATAGAREFQIKAVFLLNFAQFVAWPDSAFASPTAPLTIAVVGDDPFGPALDQALAEETVRGRPVVLERYPTISAIRDCHVLYISSSMARQVDDIVARLKGKPTLTVSDVPRFARRGGIVMFYTEGAKVRFEINPQAAQASGLRLNAQLLNLARIVSDERR